MNEQMAKGAKSKTTSGERHLKSTLFRERGLLQLKENLMFIVTYYCVCISLAGQCDTWKIVTTSKG